MSPLARLHPTTEAVEAPGLILRRGALSTYPPKSLSQSVHECPRNRVRYTCAFLATSG